MAEEIIHCEPGRMRLFSETVLTPKHDGYRTYTETAQDGGRILYLEGIFAQAEVPNRNERVYPKDVLFESINEYNEEKVKRNLGWGELDHPADRVHVLMKEVSHRVTDLRFDGNNVIGKAIVATDTPNGKIVEGLLKTGGQIAVSTRGLGRSKPRPDGVDKMEYFKMFAIDVVSFPSGIDCFPNGYNESFEYFVENGILSKVKADKIIKETNKDISADEFRKAVNEILKGI